MTILAIDTSCDDTSAAVTRGNRVLSNVVWSQDSLHAKWGGVVPSLAKRAHQDRLPWVVFRALRLARRHLTHATHATHESHFPVTAIAVTIGPGLAPALEAGIHYAKQLSLLHEIPLIPVNHLEGHIASAFAIPHKTHATHETHATHLTNAFALVVSGGHTQLVITRRILNDELRMKNEIQHSNIQNSEFRIQHSILADTLDDALGEALDKAARMLGLGYPGGAVLEKFAREGDPTKYKLPLPLLGKENQRHFSFSGLKTAFYRLVEVEKVRLKKVQPLRTRRLNLNTRQQICDLAACFQSTAFNHLIRVVSRTLENEKVQPLGTQRLNLNTVHDFIIGGGVAANVELRKRLRKLGKQFGLKVHFPYSKKLCTDNAAMIGLAAQYAFNRGQVARAPEEISAIDRQPNLNFAKL